MAGETHDTLQRLVDELAESLGRPVDLEDRDLHVLAYSAHEGAVDSVRQRSILTRASPREVEEWMRAHGTHAATGPLRVPAAPDLGMLARVCVPVRDTLGLLGFLWLVDESLRPVTDDEIAETLRAAESSAPVLRAAREAEDADRARHHALLRSALAGNAVAAEDLVRDGVLQPTPYVTVAITRAAAENAGRLRRLAPSRHALDHVGLDGTVVLALALAAGADAGAIAARIAQTTGGTVGIGTPRPEITGLVHCLDEARAALRVADAVPGHGSVVRFETLGPDGTLALLEPAALAVLAVSPVLDALAAADPDDALRATLLGWLDRGGDAAAAATDLSMHRATLYQRLKRIEAVTGVALEEGDTRLALHLALRARRLLPRT